MHVLVVGGTGTAGRPLVRELLRRGSAVRVLSRRGGAPDGATAVVGDLTTGAGLADAVAGVDAVVDCSNAPERGAAAQLRHFVDGTARLLEAEAEAGVGHHVLLSIVGAHGVPWSYYEAKVAQEHALAVGPVPGTVVPAAQFHEFPSAVVAMAGPLAYLGIVPVPRGVRVRPVATSVVAEALADAVEAGPSGRAPDVVGPQEELLDDLVRRELRTRSRPGHVLRVPVPGELGRRLRSGVLLGDEHAAGLGPTWETWLRERRDSRLSRPGAGG